MQSDKFIINPQKEIDNTFILQKNKVLDYLKLYAKRKLNQGKTKARELFPKIEIISAHCDIDIEEIKKIILELEKEGKIIRFHAHRYLKEVWDKLNSQIQTLKAQAKKRIKKEIIKPKIENIITKDKKFILTKINELFIIKIILCIMLITSILIEMNYNIENFIFMMGNIKGVLTGIALVLYDCIALSLIIFVIKMKFKINNNFFGYLKLFISKGSIIALLFCLFIGVFYILQINIMTGLFEKYQNQLFNKKEKLENKDLILLQRYEKEERELEREINIRNLTRDKLNEKLQTIEDIESNEYKNLNYKINLLNNEINKLRKELNIKRDLIENIYKQNNNIVMEERLNFFELISLNIFKGKIKANWLQIIQVFFPALIFNLISSASMGLLLFLKKED